MALLFEDMNILGRARAEWDFFPNHLCRQGNLRHSKTSGGLSKTEHAEVESNKGSALSVVKKIPHTLCRRTQPPFEHGGSSWRQQHLRKMSLSQAACRVLLQSQAGL